MRSPWSFNCKNETALIQLDQLPNPATLQANFWSNFPYRDVEFTKDASITFTRLSSSARPDGPTYDSNEAILKLSVWYRGRAYWLPIVAIVDSELSLIRGFLLGYNKLFGTFKNVSDSVSCSSAEGQSFAEVRFGKNITASTDEQESLPHLTFRDYALNGLSISGLSRLNVRDREVKERVIVDGDIRSAEVLCRAGLHSYKTVVCMRSLESFVVEGASLA